jgi:hypothetical protein
VHGIDVSGELYYRDGSAFQEPNLEIDDLIDTHAMMALFDINDFKSK